MIGPNITFATDINFAPHRHYEATCSAAHTSCTDKARLKFLAPRDRWDRVKVDVAQRGSGLEHLWYGWNSGWNISPDEGVECLDCGAEDVFQIDIAAEERQRVLKLFGSDVCLFQSAFEEPQGPLSGAHISSLLAKLVPK